MMAASWEEEEKTRPVTPSCTSSGSAGKLTAATGRRHPNMSTTFR